MSRAPALGPRREGEQQHAKKDHIIRGSLGVRRKKEGHGKDTWHARRRADAEMEVASEKDDTLPSPREAGTSSEARGLLAGDRFEFDDEDFDDDDARPPWREAVKTTSTGGGMLSSLLPAIFAIFPLFL